MVKVGQGYCSMPRAAKAKPLMASKPQAQAAAIDPNCPRRMGMGVYNQPQARVSKPALAKMPQAALCTQPTALGTTTH